ncbi:MAG: hypothetical protein LIP08_09275 [Bacteroides sp.]|nr:hypothetical protein [Bacteroides sp.]
MKEEDNVLRKVGTENAFKVPEGYFENLTTQVMDCLPEKEKPAFKQKTVTLWDKVKPWSYMAAMFVGAALIIRVASTDQTPMDDRMVSEAELEMISDEYIHEAVNGSMLDDYSLYMYLSDANLD